MEKEIDTEKIINDLEESVISLNSLNVIECKAKLIDLIREISGERMPDGFSDSRFELDEKFKPMELIIDEIVVNDSYELSECLRGFRILEKAYKISCKPNKVKIISNYQ